MNKKTAIYYDDKNIFKILNNSKRYSGEFLNNLVKIIKIKNNSIIDTRTFLLNLYLNEKYSLEDVILFVKKHDNSIKLNKSNLLYFWKFKGEKDKNVSEREKAHKYSNLKNIKSKILIEKWKDTQFREKNISSRIKTYKTEDYKNKRSKISIRIWEENRENFLKTNNFICNNPMKNEEYKKKNLESKINNFPEKFARNRVYSDNFKDRKIRKQILLEQYNKCGNCEIDRDVYIKENNPTSNRNIFQLHHIDHNTNNDDRLNLIYLCHKCHSIESGNMGEKEKEWIKILKNKNLEILSQN